MKDRTFKRHIAKTVTWRVVGTLDTFFLAWLITGNSFTGLKIGLFEVVTKMLLYYFHERFWFKIKVGGNNNSRRRHLFKTISWRILGTLDTMILAWIISGSPTMGLKIGMAEVVTKMILYYLHERAWYKFDYGLVNRKKMGKYPFREEKTE